MQVPDRFYSKFANRELTMHATLTALSFRLPVCGPQNEGESSKLSLSRLSPEWRSPLIYLCRRRR
jgi:hypothetical protein